MTDRDLIKRCIANDASSQRVLFERFAPLMMTVCRRYTSTHQEAEDVLQEAFIRVFSYLHQFRFDGPLEGWIKRIVTNCALRNAQNNQIKFSDIDEGYYHTEPETLSNLNEEDILSLIQDLPQGYRLVFNLHVIDGYSHEEIAKLLNIEPVTSRSQLMKARKLLQRKIQSVIKF